MKVTFPTNDFYFSVFVNFGNFVNKMKRENDKTFCAKNRHKKIIRCLF